MNCLLISYSARLFAAIEHIVLLITVRTEHDYINILQPAQIITSWLYLCLIKIFLNFKI